MGTVAALSDVVRRSYPQNPRLEELRKNHLRALREGGMVVDEDGTGPLSAASVLEFNGLLSELQSSLRGLRPDPGWSDGQWASHLTLPSELLDEVSEELRGMVRRLPEDQGSAAGRLRFLDRHASASEAIQRVRSLMQSIRDPRTTGAERVELGAELAVARDCLDARIEELADVLLEAAQP
jgi:hypothetical protein